MRLAGGTATYVGIGTAQVRGDRGFGSTFDLIGGNAVVAVDFGSRTVDTTLDFAAPRERSTRRSTPSRSTA
jgi:hypothetical protein